MRRVVVLTFSLAAVMGCSSLNSHAFAVQPAAAARVFQPNSKAYRGLSGVVTYDGRWGVLRAKPDQKEQSPVIVRVGPPNESKAQRIEYVGAVAGRFDLRDYVELADGSLPPAELSLPIEIISRLAANANTDVGITEHVPVSLRSSYVPWAIGLGVVWLAIPVIVFIRRRLKSVGPVAPEAPPRERTVEDEIRELLASAQARELSTDECARVELLMLRYLRSHGAAESATLPEYAAHLSRLRTDAAAGPLIREFEAWLHMAPDRARAAPGETRGPARSVALAALAKHVEHVEHVEHGQRDADAALTPARAEVGP